jgi:hypothetical protein
MPRHRIHPLSESGTTNASRSAKWRAKKRQAEGKPALLTAAEKHMMEKRERRRELTALKNQLTTRWGDRGAATWVRLYAAEWSRLHGN